VEKYSPNSGQWTPVTSMLTQRCRLGVATLNGKLYVCGGYDGSTFLETVEEYDPLKDKWVKFMQIKIHTCDTTLLTIALVRNNPNFCPEAII
jgi:N-acetylneuraminic acid mutarotase